MHDMFHLNLLKFNCISINFLLGSLKQKIWHVPKEQYPQDLYKTFQVIVNPGIAVNKTKKISKIKLNMKYNSFLYLIFLSSHQKTETKQKTN